MIKNHKKSLFTGFFLKFCLGMGGGIVLVMGGFLMEVQGATPWPQTPQKASYAFQEKETQAEREKKEAGRNFQGQSFWIAEIESYFNRIQYLKADFVQHNPDGTTSQGTFYLSRPSKMRIEYRTPQPLIILSDGQFLIQYDPTLDEVSKTDLELSPASILLAPSVKLQGGIQVTALRESQKEIQVTLLKTGEEDLGTLTFRFQKTPFDLKGWNTLDSTGQEIVVSLKGEIQRPQILDYSLFRLHRRPKS